jgi:pyocin activator protein PrtN
MFLLMAQYNGAAVVPLEVVCRDFFSHLTVEKLLRKALRGGDRPPHLKRRTAGCSPDLADYIDKRRAAAIKECRQLTGES